MLITTDNKTTFFISYLDLPHNVSANDNLWGFVPNVTRNSFTVKLAYEQYMWQSLLFMTPQDNFLDKKIYNRFVTPTSYRSVVEGDPLFLSSSSSSPSECSGDQARTYELYLTGSLKRMNEHKRCVEVVYAIVHRERYLFEPFQKSMLLEHLLFYVAERDPGIVRPLVTALYPYLAFDYSVVSHAISMYRKKHYVSIIPRRHGKTMMMQAIITAFLVSYSNFTVLAVAQNKKLITTTKSSIVNYLEFWRSEYDPTAFDISFPVENVLVKFAKTGQQSLLICVSAHHESTLRGPDPQIVMVDEALAINSDRYPTILALGQKRACKIGLLSSPTIEGKERIIQLITQLGADSNGTNFYHVKYYCGSKQHNPVSSNQQGCVNLMFYKPRHIVFSNDNRILTEIMTCDPQFYEGELGIIKDDEIEAAQKEHMSRLSVVNYKGFGEEFYDYFRSVRCLNYNRELTDFFIYVDPAYCATISSGLGISCCALDESFKTQSRRGNPVLFYLDQFFLEIHDLPKINAIIVARIMTCIRKLVKTFSQQKLSFFVAVENNNNIAMADHIYHLLSRDASSDYDLYLYYSERVTNPAVGAKVPRNLRDNTVVPGYFMSFRKRSIVNEALHYCNRLFTQVSLFMPFSHTIAGQDPLTHLLSQCRTFMWIPDQSKYTGKLTRTHTDDMIISTIMSIYLALTYGGLTDEFTRSLANPKPQVIPWTQIFPSSPQVRHYPLVVADGEEEAEEEEEEEMIPPPLHCRRR